MVLEIGVGKNRSGQLVDTRSNAAAKIDEGLWSGHADDIKDHHLAR